MVTKTHTDWLTLVLDPSRHFRKRSMIALNLFKFFKLRSFFCFFVREESFPSTFFSISRLELQNLFFSHKNRNYIRRRWVGRLNLFVSYLKKNKEKTWNDEIIKCDHARDEKERVKNLTFSFSIVIFIVTLSEHVTSRSRYDDWEKEKQNCLICHFGEKKRKRNSSRL